MTVFSAFLRIFNILNSRELPVIRVNFFLENKDIDRLLKLGFSAQTHRFNANSLALDLAGKTEAEMVSYLKNRFGDYLYDLAHCSYISSAILVIPT